MSVKLHVCTLEHIVETHLLLPGWAPLSVLPLVLSLTTSQSNPLSGGWGESKRERGREGGRKEERGKEGR